VKFRIGYFEWTGGCNRAHYSEYFCCVVVVVVAMSIFRSIEGMQIVYEGFINNRTDISSLPFGRSSFLLRLHLPFPVQRTEQSIVGGGGAGNDGVGEGTAATHMWGRGS
jgi:hypothetical protein